MKLDNDDRLSDEDFLSAYYSGFSSQTSRKIIRVRRLLEKQLETVTLRPSDNLALRFPDIPLDEVVREICGELDLTFSDWDYFQMDGSLDSIIQWVVEKN